MSALPPIWPMGHRAPVDILRIAHRGGASGAEDYRPENLHRIAGLGIHLVEVDLQSTKDGQVVAYHDLTVRADGVQRQISDLTLALLLGTLTAIGLVDDHVISALGSTGAGIRTNLTTIIVGILLLLWLGVKTTARSSAFVAVSTSVSSLAAALLLSWMLFTPGLAPSVIVSLIGLRWLIIDVIAFAADSSGLLDRLLPKNS